MALKAIGTARNENEIAYGDRLRDRMKLNYNESQDHSKDLAKKTERLAGLEDVDSTESTGDRSLASDMSNAKGMVEGASEGDAGKTLASLGMMTSNPVLAGVGLGLSFLSQRSARRNQDYMDALQRRQAATQNLINTYRGQGKLF